MNKLIRRIATMGASIAVVGGTVLAAEGSASAVVFAPSGHHGAIVAVSTADARYSPWIADQLALFEHGNGGDSGRRHHYEHPGHDHSERREL
ncbi:hypothetical protein ACWDBO_44105 [Streptomyces mirabilis]|uniref:hypothetical protein n=1 Tax=Streptomyces TaxID=1883 RepID=UPI0029BD2580|nr:hypothetical protein [Streptomyces sp. AK02-04a]MDX3761886.1 hypothetical protein [Streptomyces sp. AK02-04a]